jgi:hypothetical protein
MRYERQVVLEMQSGAGVPVAPSANEAAGVMAADSKAATSQDAGADAAKPVAKPVVKAGTSATQTVAGRRAAVKGKPATKTPVHASAQSETAHSVKGKKADPKAKHVDVVKHHPVVAKPSAGTTQYHPSQVAHP